MLKRLLPILALALVACRTPAALEKGGLEKGGLVPLKVDEAQLTRAYTPRRLALVVGISQFDDPHWRALRYPDKDARDLADALRDPERGHFDHVEVLSGPEQTTRSRVLEALRALREQAVRPDDVVVVYLSTHGTLARDEKGELRRFLVTRDASFRSIPQSALSIDGLKAEFDQLPSRRRLLVLATCHSGSGKSLLPKELEEELASTKAGFLARPLEESSRASMVFAACDWGETAREDETLQNDIYTRFLIDGLKGEADRNVDGAVTATEAHDYARRRTFAFTEGRQRPSAEILEVGADPIVLAGSIQRSGRPELYSYNPRLDGFTLKVDGEPRAELPGGAAVVPGKRTVELTKGGSVLVRRQVHVGDGERLPLEQLLIRGGLKRRSLSLMGGATSFLDGKSRKEILGGQPQLTLALRFDDAIAPRIGLQLDASGSRGRSDLVLSPGSRLGFDYRSLSLGLSLPYQWRFERYGLQLGPRVAGLLLQRAFRTEAYQGRQDYLTVSPGVMGGASLYLGERLELQVQGQLMVTYLVVDGQGRAVGSTGGWAGLGYRF